MSSNKIVRSVCYFTNQPSQDVADKLAAAVDALKQKGYVIQTRRVCAPIGDIGKLKQAIPDGVDYWSIGTVSHNKAIEQLPNLYKYDNTLFNIDLSSGLIERKQVDVLFEIIKKRPEQTFNFTYVFNNVPSSPYFPAGSYERDGFSVGLQPTNLGSNCSTLEEWLAVTKQCWEEITDLFAADNDFLGIDGSTAPLVGDEGSLVKLIRKFNGDFSHSVTTDIYTKITRFLKEENPKPTGLNGLMLPCLEDTELAAEYEKGNFSIERNIYLSLHSGLGIDTYPIGVDESPKRVVEILSLIQALSNKYKKPLSARFVSDGKAKIGERTDYQNQYLVDCVVRPL